MGSPAFGFRCGRGARWCLPCCSCGQRLGWCYVGPLPCRGCSGSCVPALVCASAGAVCLSPSPKGKGPPPESWGQLPGRMYGECWVLDCSLSWISLGPHQMWGLFPPNHTICRWLVSLPACVLVVLGVWGWVLWCVLGLWLLIGAWTPWALSGLCLGEVALLGFLHCGGPLDVNGSDIRICPKSRAAEQNDTFSRLQTEAATAACDQNTDADEGGEEITEATVSKKPKKSGTLESLLGRRAKDHGQKTPAIRAEEEIRRYRTKKYCWAKLKSSDLVDVNER
ncbi:hypothetical protein CHARACLAT_019363, partial [Characodon lateralis]|nr:hypothetical protein [Characodon lateralis]